jgi:hypothetical protein
MVANDLDSARFDPVLVRAVARSMTGGLEIMLGRVDNLVCDDFLIAESIHLLVECARPVSDQPTGTHSDTTANCQWSAGVVFIPMLVQASEAGRRTLGGYLRSSVSVNPSEADLVCVGLERDIDRRTQNIRRSYDRIVDPLLTAMRRELGAIIGSLHRIDFGDARRVDPMSNMGGGASLYMKDLVEKLAFIKAEVMSTFSVSEEGRIWYASVMVFNSLNG